MSQQCVCKHRPQESSDSPTTQSFPPTHEDTEPKRRAAGQDHTQPERLQPSPSPYRDFRITGLRCQGPHAPASPGPGNEFRARVHPSLACPPAPSPGQGNLAQILSILAAPAQSVAWTLSRQRGYLCQEFLPDFCWSPTSEPGADSIPMSPKFLVLGVRTEALEMGGSERVNRYLCSVSTCRRHLCACSLVCSVTASRHPSHSTPGFSAGSCQRALRPPAQHTPQGAWQGGTHSPEEPRLTKPALTTPALSVEAWDPAITSSWERLLPLPGSTLPAVPGHTLQGPFQGSRPFEGAP